LSIDRAQFVRELHNRKIGTSVHFIPIPLHSYYSDRHGFRTSFYPRAMQLYSRLVSLPLYPTMTTNQAEYVIDCIKDIVVAAQVAHQPS
jgi:dTDP-4-amino-4,6-dideoxygalactose transaminase